MTDATGSERKRPVDRDTYPRPEYRFPDVDIATYAKDSTADFPPPQGAPEAAPNVVVVLIDDAGYGLSSTFGGLIETPTFDRLADEGLRYCQFHTTALCAPTRASLLTGRNHHTAASGVIGEQATGFPGYTGIIPKSCGTFVETLSQNGYATAWFGKNHNVPDNMTSPAGPFDNWPTNMGFDYFYGFIAGETDQFYPQLVRNTTPVEPPRTPEEGYHLTEDLADECVQWMRTQKSIAPDRPFFAYFAPGAMHAPHQPPLDRRGRHDGQFDFGWDEYRARVFQRQLDLGVIPSGTDLTERHAEIPAWDDHTEDEQHLFRRQFENFADYLAATDEQVGRLVDTLEELGELDNTLFLYVMGDNGSSAEGTLIGTFNEIHTLNGYQEDIADLLPHSEEWGMPGSSPHMAVGWAHAGDTPFQWTKQIASHFGGTRNGMVVHWPARITDAGSRRFQFHHVIDVAPTVLEAVGISEPTMVNGVPQTPIDGTSFAYTFTEDPATSRHRTQYFEMYGNRGIYHDGWMASCRHGRLPWIGAGSFPWDDDTWELYDIADDFSQAHDLAAQHPEKLAEMQELFLVEASKHNVLPLDDRFAERLDVRLRPSYFFGREHVSFPPSLRRLPEGSGPKLNNVDHVVSVPVTIPDDGAEGVLFHVGGDAAGWVLYIRDGKLVYHYNFFNLRRHTLESDRPVPHGDTTLGFRFTSADVPGGSATVDLVIDGEPAGHLDLPEQVRARFGVESMSVGVNTGSPVDEYYRTRGGFPFTGRIHRVDLDFVSDVADISPEEKVRQHLGMD
ncbi:arylsulfatase [Curtobacterium sp. PhB130]|nr:arylsulfatase [Curtobacterium sp. PhB130]